MGGERRLLHFVDRTGRQYDLDGPHWRGDDGSPLVLCPMGGLTPDQIDATEHSLWRYQQVLPIDPAHRVSLGEGYTPMPTIDWRGQRIRFKLEWFNPTGSFKDRGVSVMISHLRAQRATHVLEDSSGNGGTAVAAYCAAAGLQATILIPESTSPSKILQARAYGASTELVSGSRDDVSDEAIRRSSRFVYASHNWHPMFLQGTKTIGYEIWESLHFAVPDNIVLVAGAGSVALGCDLAFGELLAAGATDRLPRLLVGQPKDWATIAEAVNRVERPVAAPREATIAEGAAIARPVRLPEVVAAITRSGGAAVALSEDRIGAAVRALAARGLFAEPTSAVAAAALDHFLDAEVIGPDQTTVVVLTGTGLKSPVRMAELFAQH